MAPQKKVVVVGGGPVGALTALYAARRGFQVELYEFRDDPNFGDQNARPAIALIPLSLSERGIRAIEGAGILGLIEDVLAGSRPIHTRVVHNPDDKGKVTDIPMPYGPNGERLHDLPREKIAKLLLLALQKESNASVTFNHKLVSCDFKKKVASFEQVAWKADSTCTEDIAIHEPSPVDISIKTVQFDFVFGCDGAYSVLRQCMMRQSSMDFQESYMDALWCDFVIPPTTDGQHRLNSQSVHVWPAKNSIFIAQPDFDGSFRAGMIAHTDVCRELEANPEKVETFFLTQHPGIIPGLLSAQSAIEQFVSNQHISLKSVKCGSFGYGDCGVLLGDASHTMTPFHAMGMITGLEDVRIFFEDFIDPAHCDHSYNIDQGGKSFCPKGLVQKYTNHRRPDVQAMTDMSAEHFHELRIGVRSKVSRCIKSVENALHKYAPSLGWATLYWRIQFSHERFSVIRKREERQKRIIGSIIPCLILTWMFAAMVFFLF